MKRSSFCLAILALAAVSGSVQAAPASATYTYDGRGRLASVTYEDGKTITYTYDAAGNRVREVVMVPARAVAAEARQDEVGG